MANMAAVTQRYGASHLAFIIVPLVCAFFIDLANALLIPFFLATSSGLSTPSPAPDAHLARQYSTPNVK